MGYRIINKIGGKQFRDTVHFKGVGSFKNDKYLELVKVTFPAFLLSPSSRRGVKFHDLWWLKNTIFGGDV